jgi:hypothetical protein
VCCDQLLAAGLRRYADGSVQMASLIRRETDFDPEAIAVLADAIDPPPLKWSDLKYVFDTQEDHDGEDALQA